MRGRATVCADGSRYPMRSRFGPPPSYGLGVAPIVVGAAIQGVQMLVGLFQNRVSGPQKVAATQIVDEAERLMQQNLAAYLATPTPANQAAALDNFDRLWSGILTSCGDPGLADAGRRCISERQRGGQWDYFQRYRDPIGGVSAAAPPPLGPPLSAPPGSTPPIYPVDFVPVLSAQPGAPPPGATTPGGFELTPGIMAAGAALVLLFMLKK